MRYLIAALLAGIAPLGVSAPMCSPGSLPALPAEAFQPSVQGGHYEADVQGRWDLRGGGNFAEIDAQTAQVYSRAGDLCWLDPLLSAAEPGESPLSVYARTPAPADTVFAVWPGDMQFHAGPLAALPPACTLAVDRSTPLYVFDAAVASLIEFHTHAALRGVDWAERAANLRPRAAAAQDAETLAYVLFDLFDGIGDVHTSINGRIGKESFTIGTGAAAAARQSYPRLYAEFERQKEITDFDEWFAAWMNAQAERVGVLLDPDPPGTTRSVVGDNGIVAVRWGVLEGNVGYLLINSAALAGGESFTAVLDRALRELQGTRALLLDLATNTGGSTDVYATIAARFADRRRLAFTRQMPQDQCAEAQPFYLEPGGNVRYIKPVYLLTSDLTLSAAEYLTLYLRTLPQVTQVGQTTQGSLAGSFARGLPNGWALSISNHVTRDAQGDSHEGVGIRPDVPLEVFPEVGISDGRAQAIERTARLAADTLWRDGFDRAF